MIVRGIDIPQRWVDIIVGIDRIMGSNESSVNCVMNDYVYLSECKSLEDVILGAKQDLACIMNGGYDVEIKEFFGDFDYKNYRWV